jgi:hypothetical protein
LQLLRAIVGQSGAIAKDGLAALCGCAIDLKKVKPRRNEGNEENLEEFANLSSLSSRASW